MSLAIRTEKQKALVAKYTTKDAPAIGSVLDIVDDFFSVFDDVSNPLNWFNLFNDGWTLANMSSSRDGTAQSLQDLLDKVNGMSSSLDEIKNTLAEQGLTQDEINAKIDIIMQRQQEDTAMILNSISGVSAQISQMWANTVSFLSGMQMQLKTITEMLDGINSSIQEIFSKLEELEAKVEWGSIVSAVVEYQLRITHASQKAQEIFVNADDTTMIQYDAHELDQWARATADLATGVIYYLDALDAILMGKYTLGKPLMLLFSKTFVNAPGSDPKQARIFGYLVAVQCMGFGVLAKAREFLGLRSIDYKSILDARVKAQTKVAAAAYQLASQGGTWIGTTGANTEWSFDLFENNTRTQYMMAPDNTQVAMGISISGRAVVLHMGRLTPGSSVVTRTRTVTRTNLGNLPEFHEFLWMKNGPDYDLSYVSGNKIVKEGMPIVGLYLQCGNDQAGLFPITAEWNKEAGTTSWNGKGGTIYQAKPPGGMITMHVGTGQRCQIGGPLASSVSAGMMRGIRFTSDAYTGNGGTIRLNYVSDSLSADTWLPFDIPESDLTYAKLPDPLL